MTILKIVTLLQTLLHQSSHPEPPHPSAKKSHTLTRVNGGPTSNIAWLQSDVTEQCEGATKSKVK